MCIYLKSYTIILVFLGSMILLVSKGASQIVSLDMSLRVEQEAL